MSARCASATEVMDAPSFSNAPLWSSTNCSCFLMSPFSAANLRDSCSSSAMGCLALLAAASLNFLSSSFAAFWFFTYREMATPSATTPAMSSPMPAPVSAFDSARDMPSCTLSTLTAAAHACCALVTMLMRNALVWCSVLATCCIPMVMAISDCTRACIFASSSFLVLNTPITPAAALMAPVTPLMPLAIPAAMLPPVLSAFFSAFVTRMMVANSFIFCLSFSYSAVLACPACCIRRICSTSRRCSARNEAVAGVALFSRASSSARFFPSSAIIFFSLSDCSARLCAGAPDAAFFCMF